MIKIHRSDERGLTDEEWLHSFHTFSFGGYHDPQMMGFRTLRVINDDRVSAGEGFGMHPHRDMEIITYLVDGALQHKDSMGNTSVIRKGDVQLMSAGTGVTHSEFNHSRTEPVHLLQIWILPEQKNLTPSYQQKNFSDEQKKGAPLLVVSPDGQKGSLAIHQDVRIFAAVMPAKGKIEHPLAEERYAWLQIVKGDIEMNGNVLKSGDGAAVNREKFLRITANAESEFLLFDLA